MRPSFPGSIPCAANRRAVLCLILSLGGWSCTRKEEEPEPPSLSMPSGKTDKEPQPARAIPPEIEALGPEAVARLKEMMAKADRLAPLRRIQEAKNRAEFVIPAPAGFMPDNAARKIRLMLYAPATIKLGEPFRYRLELQNAAKEPLAPPWLGRDFFKRDGDDLSRFTFFFRGPDGKEKKMGLPMPTHGIGEVVYIPELKGKSDAEVEEFLERQKELAEVADSLNLTLAPGESLATRPDNPRDRFRASRSRDRKFDKPGRYQVRVVYDDFPEGPPKAPDEEEIQWDISRLGTSRERILESHKRYVASYLKMRLGRFESNWVTIEVIP